MLSQCRHSALRQQLLVAQGVVIVANTANVGYCSPQMQGAQALIRAYRPVANFQIPQPRAFFPLTGGNLYSVTIPAVQGHASGISWVRDGMFESAVRCSKVGCPLRNNTQGLPLASSACLRPVYPTIGVIAVLI